MEKFWKIHVLNAVLMYNFAIRHRRLGVSKISASQGLIERGHTLNCLKVFKGETEGFPPFPKEKIEVGDCAITFDLCPY